MSFEVAKNSSDSSCPAATEKISNNKETQTSCPVSKDPEGYVNPNNFMPNMSQERSLGQRSALPTGRSKSTIPKADEAAPWEYPSPQQFFNAVMKKGFTSTREEDVPSMVTIHNMVNERAWHEILQWERGTGSENCGGPKLVRFRGDSKILTPKARLLGIFGYSRPFDTHFWTIDRCGKQVNYIIDFYKGKETASGDTKLIPMPSFYLDVRPAGIEGIPARLSRFFI